MSAIMGIFYPEKKLVEHQHLKRMIDILAHRGSDGSNIWLESSTALGHRMLWTTPESLLENLPLVEENKELVITSDARIDNRQELISLLNLDRVPAEKITDSQ